MTSFAIEVRWDSQVISGLRPVGPLRTTVDVVRLRQDGKDMTLPGASHRDTLDLERELGDDLAVDLWARGPTLTKDVELRFVDSSGGAAVSFVLRRCWVCGYAIRSDPDTGSAVEAVTLSMDRWDRVVTPPSMRADRLAAQHGAAVRRIDVGALVSQYLDDSSAVLERILVEASRRGDVLFLDEADALFAQHTDVRDSHDRYTPGRVDEMLLRLSAFQGPIVVAEQSVTIEDPDALPT